MSVACLGTERDSSSLISALGIEFRTKSFTSGLLIQLRQFTGFLVEFPLQVGALGRQRESGAARTQKRKFERGTQPTRPTPPPPAPSPASHPWPWREPDSKLPAAPHGIGILDVTQKEVEPPWVSGQGYAWEGPQVPGVGSYQDLYPQCVTRSLLLEPLPGLWPRSVAGFGGWPPDQGLGERWKKWFSSANLKQLGKSNKTKVPAGKSRAQLGEWTVGVGDFLLCECLCG